MIAVIQRVGNASVTVAQQTIAQIDKGLLVYVAVQAGDGVAQAEKTARRIVGYRIFCDNEDKMNLSVQDIDGEILLVPQFTLATDTAKGMRPSFSKAADPADAQALFEALVEAVSKLHNKLACGQFQAAMQVASTNDGPATFILSSSGKS